MQQVVLVFTATATALMGGLFYAYTCSVMPGLGRLPDSQFLSAMQSINNAILNPFFFVCFLGPLILLPWSSYLHMSSPASIPYKCLLIATLFYFLGVFGVTGIINVPLNNALAQLDIFAVSPERLGQHREEFEKSWNLGNLWRTLSAIASAILVIVACVFSTKN